MSKLYFRYGQWEDDEILQKMQPIKPDAIYLLYKEE